MKNLFQRLQEFCRANPVLFIGMSLMTILFLCMASFHLAERSGKDRILIEGVKQGLPTDSIIKNYYIEKGYKYK